MTTTTASAPVTRTPETRATRADGRVRRFLRGREGSPWWERSAHGLLLGLTGVLYLVGLSASGWANSFYAAAVQAGSRNWEAFFYGSSDAGNSITVDKPPASLWIMELSVRMFGLSSWAILVPEALMGIATVALTYAIVRRHFGAGAALLAGGALAITPVAVLMFRFDNPDALLLLLVTAAVYFTLRGLEEPRIRWMILAGCAIGAGFLTKELQAFLVLPALGGVYLFAAPVRLRTRLLHLLAALGALVVSAGWWVAIVQLVPASLRPYIGGSQDNSFLQVVFGYNGFGRLSGDETGSVTGGGGGGAGAGGGAWGATGILRMFQSEFGGQIAWLLPAALVLFAIALVLLRRAPRTDLRRALVLLLGGWLIVTGLSFSFMAGIIHPYYAVALAPPIAGLVAVGGSLLWARREAGWARVALAVIVLGTASWAWVLLARADDWLPWLKFLVLAIGLAAAALALIPPAGRGWSAAALAAMVVAGLLAPFAYSVQTAATAHAGSIVSAGPDVASAGAVGGAPGGGAAGGGAPGGATTGSRGRGFGGPGGSTGAAGGRPPGLAAGAGSGTAGRSGATGGSGAGSTGAGGAAGAAGAGVRPGGGTAGFSGGGGAGGLLNSSSVGAAVRDLLTADAQRYTWVAAAIGSESAAGYQLATQDPVMPIGGFNGSDPSPTLAEFKADVAAGRIHYFIAGSVGASNGGSSDAERIESWVERNFTAKTVDGTTLYDLSSRSSAG